MGEKWPETESVETVDEAVLECLMVHGYLEPLRKAWPRARVVPVFHQADEGRHSSGNPHAGTHGRMGGPCFRRLFGGAVRGAVLIHCSDAQL